MPDSEHPSHDIRGSDGKELAGKRIVLCITASVAAYKAIDFSRLLIRHGADVHAVMSRAAGLLVTPEIMKWATGNQVTQRLSGDLEHIMLANYRSSDLIVVYPCTANTIGKAANGIDDTPVTSVLSVAIGSRIPVIIAPAMHQAMYENPIAVRNIETLKRAGVRFVDPVISEGKAKVVEPEQMVHEVLMVCGAPPALAGKKILVTAGSTVEFVDPVRVITNLSSGKMGAALARQAQSMGADVTMVSGLNRSGQPNSSIEPMTSVQMLDAIRSELERRKYDIVIMAAAVSDFAPEEKAISKLDTRNGSHVLKLVPTRKIVDEIKKIDEKIFLVAFKAEHGLSNTKLFGKALKKLQESRADLVAANDLAKYPPGSDMSQLHVIDKKQKVVDIGPDSKDSVARKLLEIIAASLSR